MTLRTRVIIGRSMAAVAIGSAVAGMTWMIVLSGGVELLWHEWLVHNGAGAIGFGLIAWFVMPTQPKNGAVWTSAWAGVFTGLFCLSLAASFQMAVAYGMSTDDLYSASPSDFPPLAALIPMMASWLFIPMFLVLTVGFLLFPDGKLPSPHWWWVLWLSIGSIATASVAIMWLFRPSSTAPYDSLSNIADIYSLGPIVAVAESMQLLLVPLCVGGMIVRSRRSSGLESQQFRLVVWGAATATLLVVVASILDLGGLSGSRLLFLVAIAVVIGSYGVAIAKYRLYDVDVVISRTLVYGALAVFITVVYVATVVGMGQIIGSGEEPNPVLAIAATALVAVGFQPLRRRLQSVANRLVYGRRATPYEVLSTFSQRVAAVDPTVLTQIAKALVEGTTADAAGVWMNRGSGRQLIAQWPPDHGLQIRVSPDDPPEYVRVAEVVHDNEPLGLVTLSLQPGQPFSPVDAALLDQVAAGLGLALRNLRLTEDLRDRLEQLRDSRRRIVAVQDRTRRRLERDLHDGAQQRLVSLKIKLGIGSAMATEAGFDDVRDLLDTLRIDADQTIEAVRDFARGIYPPLLEAEGLGTALVARTATSAIPVTVQAAGVSRYSRDVEATVYFSVLEAVQNAVKHSGAGSVLVTMADHDGHLTFEVRDDGKGFDVNRTPFGPGLTNVTDRIDALDGILEVSSSPGKGTIARGTIPTRELVVTG